MEHSHLFGVQKLRGGALFGGTFLFRLNNGVILAEWGFFRPQSERRRCLEVEWKNEPRKFDSVDDRRPSRARKVRTKGGKHQKGAKELLWQSTGPPILINRVGEAGEERSPRRTRNGTRTRLHLAFGWVTLLLQGTSKRCCKNGLILKLLEHNITHILNVFGGDPTHPEALLSPFG